MNPRISVIGLAGLAITVSLFALSFVTGSRSAQVASVSGSNIPGMLGTAMVSRDVPTGFREFRDERYHVSLLYPAELEPSFIDEGNGAGTFTFQNADAGEGFEIFIVPYTGDRMFDDRFKQDVPSGVRTDVTKVIVASTSATAFDSTDAHLGETREVWFTHDGLLYEVVTFKSLDTWLAKSLDTWQFI